MYQTEHTTQRVMQIYQSQDSSLQLDVKLQDVKWFGIYSLEFRLNVVVYCESA